MASVKDTATFFAEGSHSQFEHVLKLYPQALRLKAENHKSKKPEELIKLDNWYQNELPKKIKSRGKDAHLNHEEICQVMKWKQTRGKFYPQLSYLVKVNTPRAVMAETKKAFKKLPNLEQAIMALSNLKGVGTTMASALLAAAAPENAPFMADECLMAIPEIEGIDYTTKEYLNFVQHIQNTVERLNKQNTNGTTWTPHRVELALWSHYIASELKPELLDGIPEGNDSEAIAADVPDDGVSTTPPTQENGNSHPTTNGETAPETSDDSNLEPLNNLTSGSNDVTSTTKTTHQTSTTTTTNGKSTPLEPAQVLDENSSTNDSLDTKAVTSAASDDSMPPADEDEEPCSTEDDSSAQEPPTKKSKK